MIELPEFMNGRVIERTYRRMMDLQDAGGSRAVIGAQAPMQEEAARRTRPTKRLSWRARFDATHYKRIGLRMAVARDPRLLLFLEKGAEYLRARNDEQRSMIEQLGYVKANEFSEFALWRTAYEKAVEPKQDVEAMHDIWGWVYAAVAEALMRG